MKSFEANDNYDRPADAVGWNRETAFLDENETHASTSDPDARPHRKEAKLCFMGRALMENRDGLLVDARPTQPNGHAERVTALHLEPHSDHPQASTPPASRISCGR